MHTMPLMGRGLTDGGARHGDDEVAATVTGAGRVCPLRVWKNGVEENGGAFTEGGSSDGGGAAGSALPSSIVTQRERQTGARFHFPSSPECISRRGPRGPRAARPARDG